MPWPLPANFDGSKFAARYGLKRTDFWAEGGQLYLAPGVMLPDDPPILEVCEPRRRSRDEAVIAAEVLVWLDLPPGPTVPAWARRLARLAAVAFARSQRGRRADGDTGVDGTEPEV